MKYDFFKKINNGWIFNTNVGKHLSHITLGPQNLSNKNTKAQIVAKNRPLSFPVLAMEVKTLVVTEFAITRSFHTSTTVFIPYLMQQHPCRFWSYQCNQLGQWQHWATQDLWISKNNQEGHRKVWGSIPQRFHSSEFFLCSMLMIRLKKLFSISLPSQKMHHLF